jgi:hypothetical protein
MGVDEFSNDVEFLWRKSAILTEIDRFQPKFAYQFIPLHMDMLRFAAIEAIKEEAIGAWDIFDTWHLFLVKPNFGLSKDVRYIATFPFTTTQPQSELLHFFQGPVGR